jgi:peptidoglycan hydrolase-like protein with peptidoglycan-binding domain
MISFEISFLKSTINLPCYIYNATARKNVYINNTMRAKEFLRTILEVDAPDAATKDAKSDLKSGPPFPSEDIPAVKALQTRLEELGYSVGSTGVDGKYGPRTTVAVSAFKKDNNIAGNGMSMSDADLSKLKVAKKVANPTPTGAKAPGGELGPLAQDSVTQGKVGEVLNFIARPESGGRYDAVYPGGSRPEILTMTLDQLFQDMNARGRTSGSSASGRYQYIRPTLQAVTQSMGLDTTTTKFDAATQDKIAIYHLRANHGLDKWLSGGLSNEKFLDMLSKTWAGLPNPGKGGSFYAGVLDNKAGSTVQTALAGLDKIQGTA